MQILYTKALSLVDSNFTGKGGQRWWFSICAAATGNVDLGNDIIMKGAFNDYPKQPTLVFGKVVESRLGQANR